MLWLFVIVITGGLLFVMFHKPPINTSGVGWVPPQQRQPPSAPKGLLTAGSEPVQAQVPQTPDTFDFNDMYKKPAPPSEPPSPQA